MRRESAEKLTADSENRIPDSLARRMAILPQRKNVAVDLTVEQLVQYGRYPHVPFGRMDSPISRGAGHNVWLLDRIRRGNRVYSAEPVRDQAIKVCGYWRREDYRGCGSCLRIR